jgi:hypothetical protein
MAYLAARRYGLTRIEPSETLRAAGWRQVWQHPRGLLAMRHPWTGRWIISDGLSVADSSFCSSLRAAARKLDRIAGSPW